MKKINAIQELMISELEKYNLNEDEYLICNPLHHSNQYAFSVAKIGQNNMYALIDFNIKNKYLFDVVKNFKYVSETLGAIIIPDVVTYDIAKKIYGINKKHELITLSKVHYEMDLNTLMSFENNTKVMLHFGTKIEGILVQQSEHTNIKVQSASIRVLNHKNYPLFGIEARVNYAKVSNQNITYDFKEGELGDLSISHQHNTDNLIIKYIDGRNVPIKDYETIFDDLLSTFKVTNVGNSINMANKIVYNLDNGSSIMVTFIRKSGDRNHLVSRNINIHDKDFSSIFNFLHKERRMSLGIQRIFDDTSSQPDSSLLTIFSVWEASYNICKIKRDESSVSLNKKSNKKEGMSKTEASIYATLLTFIKMKNALIYRELVRQGIKLDKVSIQKLIKKINSMRNQPAHHLYPNQKYSDERFIAISYLLKQLMLLWVLVQSNVSEVYIKTYMENIFENGGWQDCVEVLKTMQS
jgi:hypothetical protein